MGSRQPPLIPDGGSDRWGSRAPTLALPHKWGRVQKYLLQKHFVAPNSLPPLVGAGLGVGAREPPKPLRTPRSTSVGMC